MLEGWEGLGVGGSGAGEAAALERPGGAPEAVRRLLRELGRDTGVDGCLRVKRRIWGCIRGVGGPGSKGDSEGISDACWRFGGFKLGQGAGFV